MTKEELERETEEYRKELKSKFFLSESQLDLACQGFKDGYLAGAEDFVNKSVDTNNKRC